MTSALAVLPSTPVEDAGPPAWVWVLLLVACAVATRTDLRSMRIPNWLTLPLFALGVSYWGIQGGLSGVGDSLLGALICGGIFIGAYILAGGGAGDAKLMLAMGAWVGSDPAVVLVLGVTFAGFVWSMIMTIKRLGLGAVPITILHGVTMTRLEFRKVLRSGVASNAAPEPTDQLERPDHWMPYAPAILVGTIASWWYWNTYGAIL
jgi:prepilin peptidase CpaA